MTTHKHLLIFYSKDAYYLMGKVKMLTGDYRQAIQLAQKVLEMDSRYINAVMIKAESLYNSCQFEHALLSFHKARVS